MNKRNSQNERLDRVGRALFEAAKMRDDEIEKIVSAQNLFASVKTRISAEQNKRAKKSFFGNLRQLTLWNWQRISVVSAALFFLIFGAFGLVIFNKLTRQIETVSAPQIESSLQPFEFETEPKMSEKPQNLIQTETRAAKLRTIAKQIAVKTKKTVTKKPPQRINLEKNPKSAQTEPNGEFYAIAYAGSPVEKGEMLQIVRAELSPSSLFALGVNLPIENAPEKIKTDLLIGSDGIARAIRFVE